MSKINYYFALILFFLISCDFSPALHKDIIIAQKYIDEQRYIEAARVYEQILEKNPQKSLKTKIIFQLGEIYYLDLNKFDLALEKYSLLIKESEEPLLMVKAEERRAEIYFEAVKDYQKAIESYGRLVEFKPKLTKSDQYKFNMAISMINLKKFTDAQKILYSITNESEQHVQAIYYLGYIEFQKQNWKEAINIWNQYISIEKRKDAVINTKFLIANIYETTEDLRKAYEIYYSIMGDYPNPEVIKNRLESIFTRRIARKR